MSESLAWQGPLTKYPLPSSCQCETVLVVDDNGLVEKARLTRHLEGVERLRVRRGRTRERPEAEVEYTRRRARGGLPARERVPRAAALYVERGVPVRSGPVHERLLVDELHTLVA